MELKATAILNHQSSGVESEGQMEGELYYTPGKVYPRGQTPVFQHVDCCAFFKNDKYSEQMQGERWFGLLNTGFAFPPNIEGYWRDSPEIGQNDRLPFPVIYDVEGYDKDSFLSALADKEKAAKATVYRGFSAHRHTGKPNGSVEYSLSAWSWPEGYKHYLELGVPPSRPFHLFVTGIDNLNLPDYGRIA